MPLLTPPTLALPWFGDWGFKAKTPGVWASNTGWLGPGDRVAEARGPGVWPSGGAPPNDEPPERLRGQGCAIPAVLLAGPESRRDTAEGLSTVRKKDIANRSCAHKGETPNISVVLCRFGVWRIHKYLHFSPAGLSKNPIKQGFSRYLLENNLLYYIL